jgi:hypothetical protein
LFVQAIAARLIRALGSLRVQQGESSFIKCRLMFVYKNQGSTLSVAAE